jgi:hypothetical protein
MVKEQYEKGKSLLKKINDQNKAINSEPDNIIRLKVKEQFNEEYNIMQSTSLGLTEEGRRNSIDVIRISELEPEVKDQRDTDDLSLYHYSEKFSSYNSLYDPAVNKRYYRILQTAPYSYKDKDQNVSAEVLPFIGSQHQLWNDTEYPGDKIIEKANSMREYFIPKGNCNEILNNVIIHDEPQIKVLKIKNFIQSIMEEKNTIPAPDKESAIFKRLKVTDQWVRKLTTTQLNKYINEVKPNDKRVINNLYDKIMTIAEKLLDNCCVNEFKFPIRFLDNPYTLTDFLHYKVNKLYESTHKNNKCELSSYVTVYPENIS